MLNLFEEKIDITKETSFTRKQEIKRIIEALLFSSSEPLKLDKIKEVIDSSYPVSGKEISQLIDDLKEEYRLGKRCFTIDEIAHGYLLRTLPDMHPFIEKLWQNKRGEKLSKSALEVLAIIAYKQPIIRSEIEKIRGVDSSGTLASLVERELIEVVGRLEAPGRPAQYGTTKRFLRHFGLKESLTC